MLNKVQIIGRVGRDPEVRYAPSGDAIANLSVATSERWKDKGTGEQKEKTEWHRVVVFGKLAEVVGEYVKQGALVYFEGKLETRKWEKDGRDHYTTEIKVDSFNGVMKMLGSKGEGGGQRQAGNDNQRGGYDDAPRQQQRQAAAGGQRSATPSDMDDEIPF